MLDASGYYRIRYAEVLRAVGHHLDTLRMRAITVVELDGGFLLKGQMVRPDSRSVQLTGHAVLFANDDIEALLDQAFARRGTGTLPNQTPKGDGNARYEDLLRGLGYFCDQHDLHDIVIVQTGTHHLVKGIVKGLSSSGARDALLDSAAIARLLDDLRGQRRESRLRRLLQV
jgi:hypothetical protein